MPLFEVAIIEVPTKKEAEEGGQEKLVMAPRAVIAKDPQGALLAVAMGPDAPKGLDFQKAQVLIRPFVAG